MSDHRISEFDYIRVISLLGILICHSLLDLWMHTEWLGRLLGMTFNFIFLILSALIFGISWENKGYIKYGKDFVLSRIKKLSITYYPYLVILFLFLYFTQDFFQYHKIISHFLFLPWFDRIEGFGHLWFITMIVICYIGCLITTKLKANYTNIKILIIVLFLSLILGYLVSMYNLPGYIFPYTMGYIISFKYATSILKAISKIRLSINIIQFIVITTSIIFLFKEQYIDPYSYVSYLLGIIEGISIFCLLSSVCKSLPSSKIIVLLSTISFEIYLVHEFFLGNTSIYKILPNSILSLLIFIIISSLSGWILSFLSKLVLSNKHIKKVK